MDLMPYFGIGLAILVLIGVPLGGLFSWIIFLMIQGDQLRAEGKIAPLDGH